MRAEVKCKQFVQGRDGLGDWGFILVSGVYPSYVMFYDHRPDFVRCQACGAWGQHRHKCFAREWDGYAIESLIWASIDSFELPIEAEYIQKGCRIHGGDI